MRYTVEWSQDALADLARIWNDAENREAISSMADLLDRRLAIDPSNVGESREGTFRIAHALPLGIAYEVRDQDRVVMVMAVWECRRRKR